MPLILLAEEETSTIDHVRSALASQGWLVKTVGTRDQALRAASEFAPQLVLVNDQLAGAADLIRTFSRSSGGPGVILLTEQEGSKAPSSGVEAVLAKPLDTGELIETIRQGLVEGTNKPAAPTVADTNKVFSSAEIFGDLLDDILDPEAEDEAAETEVEAAQPQPVETPKPEVEIEEELQVEEEIEEIPEPVAEEEVDEVTEVEEEEIEEIPEPVVEEEVEEVEEPEPEVEEVAEEEEELAEVIDIATRSEDRDRTEPEDEEAPAKAIPVAGLEDLEEVVREGVEAWADSVQPDETDEDDSLALAEIAEAAQETLEPEPEPEEDLESKLEDTLAGVLAASLSQTDTKSSDTESTRKAANSVDALLSQALGGLDLGTEPSSTKVEEVAESQIDDEIEALAASVEVEPIAEVEDHDVEADLADMPGAEPPKQKIEAIEVEPVEDEVAEPEAIEDEIAEEIPEPPVEEEKLEEPAEVLAEEPPVEDQVEEEIPPPAPPVKAVEFGEYTLEQQIGVGGMASVWKARRKGVEGFEKRVAIKKILPQAAENEDFVEMFIDEAKLAAQLNHSNITHIYDLGKIDDDYFIAMEYVEGKNLRQILNQSRKKKQPIPVGVALFVTAQVAAALDYAHRSKDFDDAELGLVHRDVSPQNVLISFEGDIKLCDFGIAKAVSKISTTQMGALKGKLQYMSPEQAWGQSIDHRSDLFSLGTLLYEMLTGNKLFTGDSEMAVLEAVREADVGTRIVQSPEIPAGVRGILLKALAKESDDRFDSAEEFQRGLEELIKEESPRPGGKGVSAYVRDLLDMQVEPAEPETVDEPESRIEVSEDLAWEKELPASDIEEETKPWLRKLLKRLLPVILVVAVGGGILAGLMQKDSPSSSSPASEPSSQVAEATVLDPGTAEGQPVVDPQGQPPPATDESEPVPDPPSQPQPQEPEPEAAATEEPVDQQATVTTEAAPDPTGDPELERRVEEDLQRVQQLMNTPAEEPETPAADETTEDNAEAPAEEPLTLASLWSDVTAEEGTDSEAMDSAEPGVIGAQALDFVPPAYTEAARQAGAEGTVRVSVLVDENGQVADVRLIEGLNVSVGLEEAVIEAANNATYRPATKDGVPVEKWLLLEVPFEP